MLDAIVILQLEHRNISNSLDIIQRQATNISLRDAPVNNRLLELAFEYLSGYPDQCHHPNEDVLYRKLVRRFPDLVEPLKKLVEEHELERMGNILVHIPACSEPRAAWCAYFFWKAATTRRKFS